MLRRLRLLSVLAGVGVLVVACGGDDTADPGATGGTADRPSVVVTTNILGDVVASFAGDEVEVVTIMPIGADPHDFQASAQQADQMRRADALIVNGAGFEEGLLDVIDAATDDGVPTFAAIAAVETLEFGEGGRDHGDDDHDHPEDEGHADDHEGVDPHFFGDPMRMASAVDAMADFLVEAVDGIDVGALRTEADAYLAELEALDTEVVSILADLPEDQRILVTHHEVFGYFADRYGFEVVGTVIPGGSTTDGASAGALAELADVIDDAGVPAIFADTSSSDGLVTTLADEVGDIDVVELFTESLGEDGSDGATYREMVRVNAERIAAALVR